MVYQRSPSFQMSWAGWRFKKLVILHAYASFVKIRIQTFNIVLAKKLLPFSPSTHHPAPALSLHPAQSSKPYKSKSLPSHSPEASEQLHGPHSLDVDLQAPYARMGGLRRPGFQARQRGTSKRVDVLLYHLAGKYSLHGSCKTTQFARIMPGPNRII